MQQLKQRVILLGAVLAIEIAVCCYLFVNQRYILLFLLVVPTTVVAWYLYYQLQGLKIARLIMENIILSIPSGMVWKSEASTKYLESDKAVLVIVSVFGVLAGSKVYKFNCDGIRLFSMKVDRKYIIFTYGIQEKQHHLKLLHGLSQKNGIQVIAEKFRYETGIIPVIAGW